LQCEKQYKDQLKGGTVMGYLFHITQKANGVNPVQAGIRATRDGWEIVCPYTLEGIFEVFCTEDLHPLYTGVLFPDGSHMTYNFRPGNPNYPPGIKMGDPVSVNVVGKYVDTEVEALIVEFGERTHQP
jgi:hypothetical protein